MVNIMPPLVASAQDDQKKKTAADKAKVANLTKQLRMNLQYARLKVEHGWQRHNLNEVENLYFASSRTIPRSKPSSTASNVRFIPLSQNISLSQASTSTPTSAGIPQKEDISVLDMNSSLMGPAGATVAHPSGGNRTMTPPSLSQSSTLSNIPPPSQSSSTSTSSSTDTSGISLSTSLSSTTSIDPNSFSATASSSFTSTTSSPTKVSPPKKCNVSSSAPFVAEAKSSSIPLQTFQLPKATSSIFPTLDSVIPSTSLQQYSSLQLAHSQLPEDPQQHAQNWPQSHSSSGPIASTPLQTSQDSYLASCTPSSSSSTLPLQPHAQTQSPPPHRPTSRPKLQLHPASHPYSQTLTHAHMANPYLSPQVQQHPHFYVMQSQVPPQLTRELQWMQAQLQAKAARLESVPPIGSSLKANYFCSDNQAQPQLSAPSGFVTSTPGAQSQHQHLSHISMPNHASTSSLAGSQFVMPSKTFDIPTAPAPSSPVPPFQTAGDTPNTGHHIVQAGQDSSSLPQSNGTSNTALTYDSFWSTHTRAVNWRKKLDSHGNLTALGVGGSSGSLTGGRDGTNGMQGTSSEASTMAGLHG